MSADKDEATRLADAPERIWLQVCDDADCVESFAEHDGVTWCQHRIHDSDIEYVRAERLAAQALDDALVTAHLGTLESFPNPRTALHTLEAWNAQVALDPAVSEEAAKLHGRIAALERERDDFHMEYRMKCDAETKAQAQRITALEAALEQARVALRDARASLHGHGYNAGIIAKVDVVLRAIEETRGC